MTINEILLFTFFLINFVIFAVKILNLFSFGRLYPIKIALLLFIVSMMSNIIILGASMSLLSATAIPPTRPWEDVTYVVDLPPNQLIVSALISKYSSFVTVLITLFTIIEVLLGIKDIAERTTKSMRYNFAKM